MWILSASESLSTKTFVIFISAHVATDSRKIPIPQECGEAQVSAPPWDCALRLLLSQSALAV